MMNGTHYIGESSSSTSFSSQHDLEDDRMIAVVLSEEYAKLDGAVGRRLSNLAPVPVRILTVLLLLKLSNKATYFNFTPIMSMLNLGSGFSFHCTNNVYTG